MADSPDKTTREGWLEVSGLPYIFRTLGMAVHPAKLGLALVGIILTLFLGWLLDAVWVGSSVDETTIELFILAEQLGKPYEEIEGELGIFEAFRNYERRSLLGLLDAVIPPRASLAVAWDNIRNMFLGLWWLASIHSLYFIVFVAGALLIWSGCGGAICRIAAVQFTRDEKPTLKQAISYARGRLFGGFYLAPCIPLAFVIITMIFLALGGVVLRIPIFGDLVGGLAFVLALVGGFVISLLLVGVVVGGSLFWPAVAAEGSDAFDAFSRGIAYPLSKPFKAVLYAAITTVLASICWLLINLFTHLTLTMTRTVVSFGTSPFGLWSVGGEGEQVSKLEILWPALGSGAIYRWPDWGQLAWYECFSAFTIGVEVLLVVYLMWAFLASFYFSGSTIIYFLLRHDVDGIDLEDLYSEEEPEQKESLPTPDRKTHPPETTPSTLPDLETTKEQTESALVDDDVLDSDEEDKPSEDSASDSLYDSLTDLSEKSDDEDNKP